LTARAVAPRRPILRLGSAKIGDYVKLDETSFSPNSLRRAAAFVRKPIANECRDQRIF
jgi:hypothetical protein